MGAWLLGIWLSCFLGQEACRMKGGKEVDIIRVAENPEKERRPERERMCTRSHSKPFTEMSSTQVDCLTSTLSTFLCSMA